jgi:hypothetical protein
MGGGGLLQSPVAPAASRIGAAACPASLEYRKKREEQENRDPDGRTYQHHPYSHIVRNEYYHIQ